jgi:hypothetical protein
MRYLLVLVAASCSHGPHCALDTCGSACVDTSSDVANCGSCGAACSPAAACSDALCTCPANFVPATPAFSQELVRQNVAQLSGLVTGIGLLPDAAAFDALLVAFDPMTVPIGSDIDLATAAPTVLRVGFGFDVVLLASIKGGYLATSGTLHLDTACVDGVAGTLSDVAGVEVDLFDGFTPIANGCTIAVPSVAFHIGSCP